MLLVLWLVSLAAGLVFWTEGPTWAVWVGRKLSKMAPSERFITAAATRNSARLAAVISPSSPVNSAARRWWRDSFAQLRYSALILT